MEGIIISTLAYKIRHLSMACFTDILPYFLHRQLKFLGASIEELVEVYVKQVRCVLELAAPVWTAALTLNQAEQIERVQKTLCKIIFDGNCDGYENAPLDYRCRSCQLNQLLY